MSTNDVYRFIVESNRIEGIHRQPTDGEALATAAFLSLELIRVEDVERFVGAVSPGALLRTTVGLDVRVGNHIPPRGGSTIRQALEAILARANAGEHPFDVHRDYETLHPFMDGNGRSGRVLWAWQMQGDLRLGFLHAWYYQSLERSR
jgi:hypothetical protein